MNKSDINSLFYVSALLLLFSAGCLYVYIFIQNAYVKQNDDIRNINTLISLIESGESKMNNEHWVEYLRSDRDSQISNTKAIISIQSLIMTLGLTALIVSIAHGYIVLKIKRAQQLPPNKSHNSDA